MASQNSPSSIPIPGLPQWRLEYESCLQEADHNILFKRVEIAEAAILNCREALEQTPDAAQRAEIKIALAKLRLLKKEILNF